MNLEKIGAFIAFNRKKINLTQEELAFKLNISKNAISKWERGLNLPDASLMIELSNLFNCSINELLKGETIPAKNYQAEAEKQLVVMQETLLKSKKFNILVAHILDIIYMLIIALPLVIILVNDKTIAELIIIIVDATVLFLCALTEEELLYRTGYFACPKCHDKFIPNKNVFSFTLRNFTHTKFLLKCPKCKHYHWCKKIIE